ncbi:AraC family transcriptional regulator [Cohnella sp. WQ 127256]|uniref:AraC family transcriptional regulator n=1 Tax=Cohnella sp. WQ 127256 TaxID=2938790 RepID=UPI002119B483|nr:AraC family transcriptional regulator [Cohnella sp. WQ 127256]
MTLLPDMMKYGTFSDPSYIEYMKRTAPFTMPTHHFHPYYEIYYLLSGERIYFVKDSTYKVIAGDIVFIDKNVVHKTLHSGKPEHDRIVIHIDDRFFTEAFKAHVPLLLRPFQQQSPIVRLPEEHREHLDQLIKRVLEELHNKPTGYEIYLNQAIMDLLLISSRYVATTVPSEPVYESPLHRKISDVVRYLNANYAEQIRIHELAERFFISPYYLSRTFKEVTGFTIIDYLNLTRIREVQHLLRESNLPITAVAAQTGFDNFSHFGKTFKKITRTSARDYRKIHRSSTLL